MKCATVSKYKPFRELNTAEEALVNSKITQQITSSILTRGRTVTSHSPLPSGAFWSDEVAAMIAPVLVWDQMALRNSFFPPLSLSFFRGLWLLLFPFGPGLGPGLEPSPPLVTVSPVTVQKTVKSERDDWPGLARKMALDSLPLQLKRCQGRAGRAVCSKCSGPARRAGLCPIGWDDAMWHA